MLVARHTTNKEKTEIEQKFVLDKYKQKQNNISVQKIVQQTTKTTNKTSKTSFLRVCSCPNWLKTVKKKKKKQVFFSVKY